MSSNFKIQKLLAVTRSETCDRQCLFYVILSRLTFDFHKVFSISREILLTWNLPHLHRMRVYFEEIAASSVALMQNKDSEIIPRVSACPLPPAGQQQSESSGFCPILQRTLNEPCDRISLKGRRSPPSFPLLCRLRLPAILHDLG